RDIEADAVEQASASIVLADDQHVPLRLTASRGTLGLELYAPVEIGPLKITSLLLSLPGLKFPLDLSGGVPKFRHRRGELQEMTLGLSFAALARWLGARSGELTQGLSRAPALFRAPDGLTVGLVWGRRALAFDLVWAPDRDAARCVITRARGMGLDLPALGLALRVADTWFGAWAERRGRVIRFPNVPQRVGRVLLPAVGARAPAVGRVHFGELHGDDAELSARLEADRAVPDSPPRVVRELEFAHLVNEADDALARGDVDVARASYLLALEQAPRHAELSALIAEIDLRVNGRAEAALGLLVESLPATQAGSVGAELLARLGDFLGAREAVERSASHEPFAPLAALQWLRLSELVSDVRQRQLALERAVARAPTLPETRWARFHARVSWGDWQGAISDAEHLEASETGARGRHRACVDAADALLRAGNVQFAGRLFERALRYLPDDPGATAGLARALVQAKKPRRALVLFERAIELQERAGQLEARTWIELARLLAEQAQDLPQAIARLQQVSGAPGDIAEARHLEALYRARLGDRVGAVLAFARMREAIELTSSPEARFVPWLREAADQVFSVEADPAAAERHLAVALRLAPQDSELGSHYRQVAAALAELNVKSR
ncbi:MAG TPA: tetratricopeptide repeat protein, partial [Polyangiaceae bacterium]|nr:tetratricopeptide repeat protein [Polyangiaceae bacterium]